MKKSPAGEVQIGVLDPRLLVQVRSLADEYVRIVVVVKVARGGHRRGRRVDVSNDLLSLILVMWTLTFACKSVNSIEVRDEPTLATRETRSAAVAPTLPITQQMAALEQEGALG